MTTTHQLTPAQRVADIEARFPRWGAARKLAALGHPGYGQEFAARVLAHVAKGGVNVHQAIATAHGATPMTATAFMTNERRVREFQPGETVRVIGWRGVFRVVGTASDGSLTLWGGPSGYESFRNAMPHTARRTRKAGPERVPERAAPTTRKPGKR